MVLKARSTLIVLIPVKLAILGAMVIYLKKSKFQLSGASLSRCVARNKNFSYQNQGFFFDSLKMKRQFYQSKKIFIMSFLKR